ncbi:hypothetical protein HHK36_001374 [Tetracentron sinense]|uniref:Ribosomal protein S21 n=1 Tax=Tetracentron sinense TaxID=13715 RepID=A0A834ZY10_TETSI|nr:hypothetical protein HHK36_001374 [Tetracentron sinense]
MRAGVIQECKRRRFFENKQAEKKRKTREAAKKNRRRWEIDLISLCYIVLCPKSAISSCPQFSGLRRSCSKLDQSLNLSSTQSFFQQIDSHLRISSDRRGCRGVVTMAGSGKCLMLCFACDCSFSLAVTGNV